MSQYIINTRVSAKFEELGIRDVDLPLDCTDAEARLLVEQREKKLYKFEEEHGEFWASAKQRAEYTRLVGSTAADVHLSMDDFDKVTPATNCFTLVKETFPHA
jgi:hypothetical protein